MLKRQKLVKFKRNQTNQSHSKNKPSGSSIDESQYIHSDSDNFEIIEGNYENRLKKMITEARNKGNQDFKRIFDIVKEENVKVVPLKKENMDKFHSRNNTDLKNR